MNYYRYKAISSAGAVNSGFIRLPYKDVLSVASHLERDGSTIIFVRRVGMVISFLLNIMKRRSHKRLSRSQLGEFLNNLSVMLRAGIPLTTALMDASESSDTPETAGDIKDIVQSIQGGVTFSETAVNYPNLFPKTVLHLMRMGEETGRLDKMLQDAAEHLKRMQAIVDDTKQALFYPAMVFTALGGGIIFWFYYVVPKIIDLFTEMDVTLPALTLFLVKVSDFVRDDILYILAGVGIVVPLFFILRKSNQKFRHATDAGLLKLPVVGTIISASVLAFITEYLSMLLNAGIDMLQSMKILNESITNEVYSKKVEEIRENVSKGETVANAFEKTAIFPKFVVRMIKIGENSGTLTDQLDFIAEEYRKKLSILVSSIGKLIEPIVLLVAGAIFGVIFGALLLPIYDLLGTITG